MQHLEPQRLDRKTMNEIRMLRPGLLIVQQKNLDQMHVEPIQLGERKPKLQMKRQRLQIAIGKKLMQMHLVVTRHEKQLHRKIDDLAGEQAMQPKSGVRLVPIVSERVSKSDAIAMRRPMLMLGALRVCAGLGQLAKYRQILGKVGNLGAAAMSPGTRARGELRSKYEA